MLFYVRTLDAILAVLVGLAVLVLSACGGGSDRDERACSVVNRAMVVDALRTAGVRDASLSTTSDESLHQSACRYRGPGINVQTTIDSAPGVRRRYFVRVTEQGLVSVHSPHRRPQPIEGLGDKDAYGPAGAYWIPAYRQLFVLRGERLFIFTFSVRGAGAARSRAAVEQLARKALGRDEDPRPRTAAPAALRLSVITPTDGELVRDPEVTVQGTVTGRSARVLVEGRTAPIRDGIFARTVPLERSRNVIRVVAFGEYSQRLQQAITVRRGRSPREVAATLVRRAPGTVPDLVGTRLDTARAILRYAGLRHREVKLSQGRVVGRTWAVCLTRPAAGARLGRRERVVLLIDYGDIYRASGTACAQL
jgi:hypothetical protein